MSTPKYRRSRREKRNHQGQWRLSRVTVTECSRCHEPKLPHRVCAHCGYYGALDVLQLTKEEE